MRTPQEIQSTILHLTRESRRLTVAGKYQQAHDAAAQACNLARDSFSGEDPLVAVTLLALGELYRHAGDLRTARQHTLDALKIQRKAFGRDNLHIAVTLDQLGDICSDLARYRIARLHLDRALRIKRGSPASRPQLVAATLNRLGVLCREVGDFTAAEAFHTEALDIQQRILSRDHPATIVTMSELGVLYQRVGDYRAARRLLQIVLDADLNEHGQEHPVVATALTNLALVNRDIGDYGAFRALLLRAIRIQRRTLGRTHLNLAANLNDLGMLYRDMGRFARARRYLGRALEIRRAVLPPDHPAIAGSLGELATLCKDEGDYPCAERLYKEALQVRASVTTLADLGVVHHHLGDFVLAEQCYRRALAQLHGAVGDEHPHVAVIKVNLASVLAATGRSRDALEMMAEAAANDNRVLEDVFTMASERTCLAHLATLRANLASFLSLCRELSAWPEARALGLNFLLLRKGLTADSLAALRKAILGGHYPELSPKLRALTALRAVIARTTLEGQGWAEPAQRRKIAVLHIERERLEQEIADLMPIKPLWRKSESVDGSSIAAALPAGAALVEIVLSDMLAFGATTSSARRRWQPARYMAFVLNSEEDLHFVDLGEAKAIDEKISLFSRAITGGDRDLIGQPRTRPRQSPEERVVAIRAAGVALHEAVFDPLRPALHNCRRLFIAPDGDLTRLPFEALPAGNGRYVIDDYVISYLTTGRDVLRFGEDSSHEPGAPIVAADPDYDLVGAGPAVHAETKPLGRRSRDLDRSRRFGRLAGAFEEGTTIAALLEVEPLLREEVLERRLKEQRSPWILHLATHGAFLPDQEQDAAARVQEGRFSYLASSENPLLRSFLAMAGVNSWLAGKSLPEEAEDGVLSAEDVAGMDLFGTEMVVLSACETGLGQINAGEGVFGLRRAFVLAGARTLVMTLWKVPDHETQRLMVAFYQLVLAGKPRAEALRQAQLIIKEDKPDDPLYWGAFICQGEPGPLRRPYTGVRPP